MTLDPVVYALSHAAFGAIALIAMRYLVTLTEKLEERNLTAEASTQPDIVKSGAAGVSYYVYVYDDKDAKRLSVQLHSMRTRLTFAYIACLVIAFLMHSSDLRAFVGVEDLAVVRNTAIFLGLPESLMAPFGFTAYVVVELWLRTRDYLRLLRQGR